MSSPVDFKTERQGSVLKSASVMGVATFLSRILGLVREQVFAVLFGAGSDMDAFIVAFRIPNLLRDLFAEGAMSSALVPTFVRVRTEQGVERSWELAGRVFRVLFWGVLLLSLVGAFFAPVWVELFAGAFHEVEGKFELTVRMTRVLFLFFPFVALAAAYMGILNANRIFFVPALSSALFNLVSILTGIAFVGLIQNWNLLPHLHPIEGMAFGVVLGGVVQAFCQLPSLYGVGYRFRKRLDAPRFWKDPDLRRMLLLMLPGLIGMGATQINVLVNTMLATGLGPQTVAWLNYSFRLMQFPIGLFGVSLATATLPRVSQFWVEKDGTRFVSALSESTKQALAINLCASAGLAFLAEPILALLFQYGRFTPEDTRAAASALSMYAVGLTAYSLVKIFVPVCYALQDTRIPVISSVLSVALTLAFNLAMVDTLGFRGLALGTSVAAIFNFLFLLFSVRRKIAVLGVSLPLKDWTRFLFRVLILAGVLGFLVQFTYRALDGLLPSKLVFEWGGRNGAVALLRLIKLLATMGVSLIWMKWGSSLLGVHELTQVLDLFGSKIKNKLRRL